MINRKQFFIIALVIAATAIALWFVAQRHSESAKTSWCPAHQHAVVVGSGKQADGSEVVAYMCERDSKVKVGK